MRRIHVERARLEDGKARLDAAEAHYLRDVLRLPAGAALELFDGEGGAYDATFDGGATLALGERRAAPAPGARVELIVALAKGEKLELVVQKATELGVSRVAPFSAARSVVKLDAEKGRERAQRWRKIAEEAARQCGRADVPEVAEPASLERALAAASPGLARVVFHAAGSPLHEALPPGVPGASCVIGPEGGLTVAEVEACVRAGYVLASLGPRILRAETAALAAAALVQHHLGDLG